MAVARHAACPHAVPGGRPVEDGLSSSRHRHPDVAALFLRLAYSYRDGRSGWEQFPDPRRRTVSDNAEAALADIRMVIDGYATAKELASVSSPVECTCGSRTDPTMAHATQARAGEIATTAFRQIEGAGHAALGPFQRQANKVYSSYRRSESHPQPATGARVTVWVTEGRPSSLRFPVAGQKLGPRTASNRRSAEQWRSPGKF
jgi:hypothetical protein